MWIFWNNSESPCSGVDIFCTSMRLGRQRVNELDLLFVREIRVLTMTTAAMYSMSINSLDVGDPGSGRDLNH